MFYYVYILRSIPSPDKIYTGYTSNLKRRLKRHNDGFTESTKDDRPWEFIWFAGFKDRLFAMRFEKYLKTGSGIAFKRKRLIPR